MHTYIYKQNSRQTNSICYTYTLTQFCMLACILKFNPTQTEEVHAKELYLINMCACMQTHIHINIIYIYIYIYIYNATEEGVKGARAGCSLLRTYTMMYAYTHICSQSHSHNMLTSAEGRARARAWRALGWLASR
jgi:hypothetical protein